MGVREITYALLRSGLSPGQIAQQRGVALQTTLQYLDQLVGEGRLRRSDILFSIPKEVRQAVLEARSKAQHPDFTEEELRNHDFPGDWNDVEVVMKYSDAGLALGDIYEDVRLIETGLHQLIREALEKEYGEGEKGWWRRGVPESVRKKCQTRREEDEEPVSDPYCYTDLLDLWDILDGQWTTLSKSRRFPGDATASKKGLREKLFRLNQIRRLVMHPVRGTTPSEDDFEFLRDLKSALFGKVPT